MAVRKTSSGGGRKSEVVTVRLDPKLKYLAELAARRQRRPLSSYIEWAIEESLGAIHPSYDDTSCDQPTFADVALSLWDVDEADRFANLAFKYPELLTHDEQLLWKRIREEGQLWRGRYEGSNKQWRWDVKEKALRMECLRLNWNALKEALRTGAGIGELIEGKNEEIAPPKNSLLFDDDSPF